MFEESIDIFEEEFLQINRSLSNLIRTTNARAILLIDRAGQVITTAGNTSALDMASLASLSAADFEAASLLATMIGEKNFSTLFHQGEKENIYASLIVSRLILVVIFDEKTTLGMVRVRVKQATEELTAIFRELFRELGIRRPVKPTLGEGFATEAEAEIEDLFK